MRDATSQDRSRMAFPERHRCPVQPPWAASLTGRRREMLRKYIVAGVTLAVVAGSALSMSSAMAGYGGGGGGGGTTHYSMSSTNNHKACSEDLVRRYSSQSTIDRELAVLRSNP